MSRHTSAEILSAYLDREISASEAERLERHLGECAECRGRLEGLRRVVGALGSLERSAPPHGLGLEIQGRLLRSATPFEERSPGGARWSRVLFQPIILAALGVVLALSVVVVLFLQALGQRPSPPEPGVVGATPQVTLVVVGGRSFRRGLGGWVEVGLDGADLDAAVALERREVVADQDLAAQLGAVLDSLDGEVTLRLEDGRVVRISP